MSDATPLPRGRHGLPAEVVAENQRRRLLSGAGRALAERGYVALTVKHVIEAAGVSRTTFYEHFDNKRDCVLAAHWDVFERLVALILRACATEREWARKVRAAIAAAFAFAAEAPARVHLLSLDALAADPAVATQAVDSNAHIASLLREGRRHTPLGGALPDLTEEALVDAVGAIVSGRLRDRGAAALEELEPEIVQLVLTPYVGPEKAARLAAGE